MRSVRCDVCGTKALMAASQCPKCGHAFEVRDGSGATLPLAHCATCDSYYPQSVGSCRWCGTKPERAAIGPLVWKGFGVLTFVSLAIGAWLVHDDSPTPSKPVRTFVADTLPTNQPKAESFGRKVVLAQRDSSVADTADTTGSTIASESTRDAAVAVAATDSAQASSTSVVATQPVAMQSAGTVAQTDSAPGVETTPAGPPPSIPITRTVTPSRTRDRAVVDRPREPADKPAARVLARAPERVVPTRSTARPPTRVAAKPPTRAPARAKATASRGGRWVTSVARNWAVVRADPTRQSRIVASIGPNTRVQLGETRGAWRRIKAKGLAGWVEHRTLVARTVVAPKRSGRLASRN